MKKAILAAGIATLALVAITSAALTTNLTVGSRGADVTTLQNWLISHNFSISAGATGYFGSQTKAALAAYQTSVGLPAFGFFGPLTQAKINGGAALPPIGGVVPPVGQGGSIVTGVTAGTDGSVSVSQSSFVSSGQTLKKGDTKNVVSVKLQATAGSVAVTRFDVHFNVRPWLFFSNVTLTDSTGKVIASMPISSVNDATEVVVGSDYLVRFTGLNYVVTPGVNPDIAVGVTVLAATDKIASGGTTVYAGIPSGAIRTVNGIGISDSPASGSFTGTSVGSGAGQTSFTLTSTGSIADISTRISPVAPASQTSVVISSTTSTSNVVLGIFSIKAANNSATVNGLNVKINSGLSTSTTLFSNVRLVVDGGQTYGALNLAADGTAQFTQLSIALSQDAWKDIKVIADVAQSGSDTLASTTLQSSSIVAVDSTWTNATVSGSNQTSADTRLTVNSVNLSNPIAQKQQDIVSVASGPVTAQSETYTFTLTNNSSNSLYVSSNPAVFINGVTTSPASNASSTITGFEPISAVAGDGTGYYIIPSGGGSRTFTLDGMIQKSSNSIKSERLSITSVQYGPTTAGTGSYIISGLEALTRSVVI